MAEAEGIKTTWTRSILVVLAITLHNIPGGSRWGWLLVPWRPAWTVPRSAARSPWPSASPAELPEGTAVAVPLRREGMSRLKSFWYGQLSAAVEPFAAVVGALAVMQMQSLLPYALAFAAGAMIYVVVEELIPNPSGNKTCMRRLWARWRDSRS